MLVSFCLPGNRAPPPPALRGAGHSTHTGEEEPLFDPVRLECGLRMSNASLMCFLHTQPAPVRLECGLRRSNASLMCILHTQPAPVRLECGLRRCKQKHCKATVLIIIGYKYLADGKRAFVAIQCFCLSWHCSSSARTPAVRERVVCEESTLKMHCSSSAGTPAVRGQKVAPPQPYEWSARPPGVRAEEVLFFLGGKNKPTSTPIIHSIFTYQYWEWVGTEFI